jgi:hypothetical protein
MRQGHDSGFAPGVDGVDRRWVMCFPLSVRSRYSVFNRGVRRLRKTASASMTVAEHMFTLLSL